MESSLVNEDDLDNLLDYVFKQGHGVKGLSEMGLKDLPSPFIQPIEERSCMIKTLPFKAIPIIDISNLDEDPKVEESICEAAEKLGFFQIINHGIPIPVLENVKEATRRFFQLPGEEKKKYLKEHSPTTNVRLTSSFFPAGERALEWKDFLSLFYTSEENASAFWPPVCKDEGLEYMKMSKGVARKLLQVLLNKLKVEGQESILMASARINLNYYPKCPSPELTVGVGRHSDISSLTLLLQDEIGGLYVRANDGDDGWIHVPPVTGSLIINIGDALQIMSNGRYRSIEHRVVADLIRDRVSVPVFFNPSPEQIIGPFPQLLASGEKPLYRRVLYKEYATHFYKKPHNGKDTIEFALL